MRGKRLKAILTLAMFITSLGLVTIKPVLADINVNKSTATRDELKAKNEELKKELQKSKDEIRQEGDKKTQLDKEINIVKEQIDNSNQYILKLEKEIITLEDRIDAINKDMENKIELLKESLYSIYVAGDVYAIDVILQAKTFEDFLDKADMIRSVTNAIDDIINQLNASLKEIEGNKASIEAKKADAEEETKNLKANQDELQILLDESEAILAGLQEEEQNVKKHIDENDEEVKKIEAEITRYYEQQRIKAEQEKRRKEEEARQNQQQGNKGGSTTSSSGTSNEVTGTGNYVWPVPGFYHISSDYYDTVNRTSMHGAIDIAGAGIYGSRVVASDSGEVIFVNSSGWGGGYGLYAIIDHGNGRSTLYAHMSSLAGIQKGQKIVKGQTIGYVGSTGNSTGPHLHFETRLYGKKYNPMNEFKK